MLILHTALMLIKKVQDFLVEMVVRVKKLVIRAPKAIIVALTALETLDRRNCFVTRDLHGIRSGSRDDSVEDRI